MSKVQLTINGKSVTAESDQTVLEAALGAGIDIPVLCHHPSLSEWGACRMCLVEVDGMRGLQTACTCPVSDGMDVRTETEEVVNIRKFMLGITLLRAESLLHVLPDERRLRTAGCRLSIWSRSLHLPASLREARGGREPQVLHHGPQSLHSLLPLYPRVLGDRGESHPGPAGSRRGVDDHRGFRCALRGIELYRVWHLLAGLPHRRADRRSERLRRPRGGCETYPDDLYAMQRRLHAGRGHALQPLAARRWRLGFRSQRRVALRRRALQAALR